MSSPLIRRELTSRPGRWLLIAAAIGVAVTFTTAAFGFARSVRGLVVPSTDSVTASLPQGSVVVTPRLSGLTTATALDESLLAVVRAVPGVLSASGSYDQPIAFRLRSGEGPDRPPVLRGVVFSSTTSERWELVEGRFPSGPQEVALDVGGLAVAASFLGDVRVLQVPLGSLEVGVVGVVRPVGKVQTPPATGVVSLAQATAVLDPEFAPLLLDAEGRVDRITVIPEPGLTPEVLAGRVRRAIPSQLQVIAVTSPQAVQQAAVNGIDDGIASATLGYAVLTMLVGALVVANAEHVLVAQRTRELALLRAVGARRGQIVRLVLGESAVISVFATALGLGLGVWLGQVAVGVVRSDAPRSFAVTPAMTIAALVVGLVVGVGGSLPPALRAGRVAPLDAMSDSRGGADRPIRWTPPLVGVAAGALSAFVAWSELVAGSARVAIGTVGALVLLVSVAGLSRAVVAPLSTAAGWVVTPFAGVTARLGLGNASRQPSRTAGAASTLMVGLALTAAVGVIGASARAAIADQVGSQTSVDLYAQRRGVVRVSARAVDEILGAERSGATSHVTLLAVDGVVVTGGADATTLPATATDLTALAGIVDLDIVSGAVPTRADEAVVMVSQRIAEQGGVAVGESVTLRSTSGKEIQLRVAGIYLDSSFVGPVVVARSSAESVQANGTFEQAAMRTWRGAPRERVQRRINRSLSLLPKVAVSTPTEWVALQTKVVDTSLRVIGVLLAGAIAMGLAGMAVTQGLSVVERRSELQLLWSVGASRRQLRSMISLEAVFVAAMAAAVGLSVGAGLGRVALSAAPESLTGRRVLPVGLLAQVAMAALVAAWLVSRLVARRTLRR